MPHIILPFMFSGIYPPQNKALSHGIPLASIGVYLVIIKLKNARQFSKGILFVLRNIFIDCSPLWSNEEYISEYKCVCG